ncbi:MAG: hypothetical protein IPG84_14980 [Betaproteobacteria bacterium]|nr:hypothetical protein [Betaproteobacteria bacterium]
MAAALGVPIVSGVQERRGGAIAAAYVAKAPADGYTLLLAGGSITATLPVTRKDLPYDPLRDFAPIVTLIGTAPLLVVPKSTPATTAKEFVELARAAGQARLRLLRAGHDELLRVRAVQARGGDRRREHSVPRQRAAPDRAAGRRSRRSVRAAAHDPVVRRRRQASRAGHREPGTLADVSRRTHDGRTRLPGVDARRHRPGPPRRGLPAPIADRLNREVNRVLARPRCGSGSETGYEPMGGTRDEPERWVRSGNESWRIMTRDLGYVPD